MFTLHYRANGLPTARLGLVIAKKLARRAVWRNTLKRLVREAFRRYRADLPCVDIVIRLSQAPAGLDGSGRERCRRDTSELFERLSRRERVVETPMEGGT